MSAEIWFYHLEQQGLDEVLPSLLEKCLERNWRAHVRVDSYEDVERLDALLWVYRPDSFLPHGHAGGPDAARLPILLSTDAANRNGAQAQFVLGSSGIENAEAYERVILLFNGADPDALAAARASWRDVKGEGKAASYWRQNDRGQWSKEA